MRKLILFMLFIVCSTLSAQETKTREEPVYMLSTLSDQPEYPGGIEAFYSFVRNNMRYPEINHDFKASVFLIFVVNEDGSVSDIYVPRDPGYGLAAEAIRMMKSNTKVWKPGKRDGKNVRVRYQIPIKIDIKAPIKK